MKPEDCQTLRDALLEAENFSNFDELQESELGYLSPEFITCEIGVATINNDETKETFDLIYIIIVTEMLESNLDSLNKYPNKAGLREKLKTDKNPLDRLKMYLKLARSLENIHTLRKVHNDIKPDNIVADLDLQRVLFIDYD